MALSGKCLCGQIRYTVGKPLATALCHCRHCQRQSGSAFAVNVVVARKHLAIEGQTKVFADVGASGGSVARHFCPDCGSPIMSLSDGAPGVAFVKGGTLDEPGSVTPGMEIWTDCALPWVATTVNGMRHPANPAS